MKRGTSGLSLVLPVYKPCGMSSHDVVNRVRRIMGERRVGHAGTLDPLAEGVLPVMVGPATRLDRYMAGHDKSYTVDVVFGASTTTDDIEGEIVHEGPIPSGLFDEDFAREFCAGLVGRSKQLPPVYSAIKMNGKKACDEARKGNVIVLDPRDIEVYAAELLGIGNADGDADERFDDGDRRYGGALYWTVRFSVSKGTYIRALARDMGADLGTFAHVGSLKRESVGSVEADECASLDALADRRADAAIDPMRFLEMRIVFPDGDAKKAVENGGAIRPVGLDLFSQSLGHCREIACCTPTIVRDDRALADGELVAIIVENRLKAVYRHDAASALLRPDCIFQIGVSRGACV